MGRRMKSKPQSTIHFRSSSEVPVRREGLGELKSVKLNPRHLGSGLPAGLLVWARPRGGVPVNPTMAAEARAVLIKPRRLMRLDFIGKKAGAARLPGANRRRYWPCVQVLFCSWAPERWAQSIGVGDLWARDCAPGEKGINRDDRLKKNAVRCIIRRSAPTIMRKT